MMINLHNFLSRSHANGPGERAVVWVQGCPRYCLGCFNPNTQAFVTKELVRVDDLESRILAIKEIDGVTFSGGEPFAQAGVLAELAKRLRRRGLTVCCYTGYTLKEIKAGNREDWNALLEQIDLLIDGPFIQSERCHEPYRGSANQKIHFFSERICLGDLDNIQTEECFVSVSSERVLETGFPSVDAEAILHEAIVLCAS